MNISFDVGPLAAQQQRRRIVVSGMLRAEDIQDVSRIWAVIAEQLDRFYDVEFKQELIKGMRTRGVPFSHLLIIAAPGILAQTRHLEQQLTGLMLRDYGDYFNGSVEVKMKTVDRLQQGEVRFFFGYGVFLPGPEDTPIGMLEIAAPDDVGNREPLKFAFGNHLDAAFYEGQTGVAFSCCPELTPAISDLLPNDDAEDRSIIFYLGRGFGMNEGEEGGADEKKGGITFLAVKTGDGREGADVATPYISRTIVEGEWCVIKKRTEPVFQIRYSTQTTEGRYLREAPVLEVAEAGGLAADMQGAGDPGALPLAATGHTVGRQAAGGQAAPANSESSGDLWDVIAPDWGSEPVAPPSAARPRQPAYAPQSAAPVREFLTAFGICGLYLPKPGAGMWHKVRRVWLDFTGGGWPVHGSLYKPRRTLVLDGSFMGRGGYRGYVLDRSTMEEDPDRRKAKSCYDVGQGLQLCVREPEDEPDLLYVEFRHEGRAGLSDDFHGAKLDYLGYLNCPDQITAPMGPTMGHAMDADGGHARQLDIVSSAMRGAQSFSLHWLNYFAHVEVRRGAEISSLTGWRRQQSQYGLADYWLGQYEEGKRLTLAQDQRLGIVVKRDGKIVNLLKMPGHPEAQGDPKAQVKEDGPRQLVDIGPLKARIIHRRAEAVRGQRQPGMASPFDRFGRGE